MLDVKMIRNNFAEVNEKLATRGVKKDVLERFLGFRRTTPTIISKNRRA